MTFGAGVTTPFVASLPAAGGRAPTWLCQGGYNCRVIAVRNGARFKNKLMAVMVYF